MQGNNEGKQKDELIQRRGAGKTAHQKSLQGKSSGEENKKTGRAKLKEIKPQTKMDSSSKGSD